MQAQLLVCKTLLLHHCKYFAICSTYIHVSAMYWKLTAFVVVVLCLLAKRRFQLFKFVASLRSSKFEFRSMNFLLGFHVVLEDYLSEDSMT